MRPLSRVLVQHATKLACNPRFPLTVQAEEGWVELSPVAKPRPAPMEGWNIKEQEIHHLHINRATLYTDTELDNWEQLLDFPNYHLAKAKSLFYGSCLAEGQCDAKHYGAGLQSFDLSALQHTVESELNLFQKFEQWIKYYGDYFAFIALVVFGTKFLFNLTMISLASLRAGPGAGLAMMHSIYLSNKRSYDRIIRKHKEVNRARVEENTEMQEITTPLNPAYQPPPPPPVMHAASSVVDNIPTAGQAITFYRPNRR